MAILTRFPILTFYAYLYFFLCYFFFCLLCLTGNVSAQTVDNPTLQIYRDTMPQHVGWGLRAGVNVGSVIAPIEEGATADLQVLPAGGIFCYIPIGKHWSLLPELLYSHKGAAFAQKYREGIAKFDVPELGWEDFPAPYRSYNISGTIDLHYLEMPIQLAYRYGKRRQSELTVGVQIAYLLSGKSYTQQDLKIGKLLYSLAEPLPKDIFTAINTIQLQAFDPFNTAYNDTIISISDQLKRWDYGVTLGGNYHLYKGLHIGLRCSSSVVSIFRKELDELQDNFFNLFMQITLSYRL